MSGIASRVGQRDNLLAPAGKEWIATDKKRAGAPLSQGSEGGIDLAWGAGVEHKQLQAKRACRLLHVAYHPRGFRKSRVGKRGDDSGAGNELV